MKKFLFPFFLSVNLLFSDNNTIKFEEIVLINNTPKIEQPKELDLIYKKYRNKTDYAKMSEDEALIILEYAYGIDDSITGANGSISLNRYAYKFLLTGFHSPFVFSPVITIIPTNYLIPEDSGQINLYKKSEDFMITLFLNSKTNAGKVYALMGLSTINNDLYEKYYNQINLDSEIAVSSGCTLSIKKINLFLPTPEQIKNNSFTFNF